MKKIMQINITCGVGSTGKLSEALYYATINEGYDAKFAYSAFNPTIKNAFRIENKVQNVLRRGLNKYFGKKQKHSNLGTKRLIKYIKKEKPDLIHLHNVQQNSVNYNLFFDFLKKSNIPIVYTLHDCWSFTGGCYHFTKDGCEKYKTGCKTCLKNDVDDIMVSTKLAYERKKALIGGNDNIYPICVSNWLSKVATDSYMGNMKNRPQVVQNGIDTTIFYPKNVDRKKYNINKNTFVILGVASCWTEDKGLSIFLELSKKLDFDFKIILIGSGLEKVKALNSEKFILIDRTENVQELVEYYSLADLFINTSIEETFGLTTAEALSSGTPAIVFNSTALPEVIDENTGICIPYDITALIDAVKEVSKKGKTFYAQNCRERALKMFTKERMTKDYLKIYRSILDE